MDGAVLFDTNEKRYLSCQAIPLEFVKKMCTIFEKWENIILSIWY